MNVADAMTPREDLVVVEIPGTRDDALEYIQDQRFSSVPVVKETDEGEVYRGLVSRDDLIEQPDQDQLAILMRDVPTVTADTDIREAAARMVAEDARRVPVLDGDALDGIVTVTDVIRAIARGKVDGETAVGKLATRDVNATYIDTPLPVAEREIGLADDPYTIVLDEDAEMAGMLTEVDVLDVARVVEGEEGTGDSFAGQDDDWAWEGIKAVGNRYLPTRNVEIPAGPIGEFMTTDVVTVAGTRSAKDVAQEMISNDVEQVPLMTGGDLTGIVRDVDLLEGI